MFFSVVLVCLIVAEKKRLRVIREREPEIGRVICWRAGGKHARELSQTSG